MMVETKIATNNLYPRTITPTSPPERPRLGLWVEAGEGWPYFARPGRATQGTAKVKLGVLQF